jgi:hypothetical protein
MQKWEYTSARHSDPERLTEVLNKLGQAGWELVSCTYTESYFSYTCLLKRPIQ